MAKKIGSLCAAILFVLAALPLLTVYPAAHSYTDCFASGAATGAHSPVPTSTISGKSGVNFFPLPRKNNKNLPIFKHMLAKVSSVEIYANKAKIGGYRFSYNDLGQVVYLIADRYEGREAVRRYEQAYKYDENGNLTSIEHNFLQGWQDYQYEYDYGDNGQITQYHFSEYFNDVLNKSDCYRLFYDNDGRVIKRCNQNGSFVESLSYGKTENVLTKSTERYQGDAKILETTTYDFTYAPFVICTQTSESKAYGNSSRKFIQLMPRWNLDIATADLDDGCSFEVDADGRLLRVIDADGDDVYVCKY